MTASTVGAAADVEGWLRSAGEFEGGSWFEDELPGRFVALDINGGARRSPVLLLLVKVFKAVFNTGIVTADSGARIREVDTWDDLSLNRKNSYQKSRKQT